VTAAFRSGYAAVLGRPNVGKSTLVNRVLKEKVSIVSYKPQTTRSRVLGILSTESYQLLFLDTPGIHDRRRAGIDGFMLDEAFGAMGDADVLLFVTEADAPHARDRKILERTAASGRPRVAAINKIDRLKDKRLLLPRIDALAREGFDEIVPIRATTGDGVDRVVDALAARLPEGPAYFPADQLTDQTMRVVAAEVVREQVFLAVRDEVPYATAVAIEEFADRPDGSAFVRATILVERESQKGIVIGKGGEMLRRIGAEARREIEKLQGGKVFLELVVQVRKNWTQDEAALRELGYRRG
jgi:GTP-binding protein Era